MSIINNSLLLGADAGGGTGYGISRSLRFNSSDSAFCSRTPASAGNRKTWTWAGWVKRSKITSGDYEFIFGYASGSTYEGLLWVAGSDKLEFWSSPTAPIIQTAQLFRDPSAWFHIVLACDTTQATASNRVKLYINGSQVTQFDVASYPAQDFLFKINDTVAYNIGSEKPDYGRYFNGYLADIHFIDGQALTPSSFTEVSATTGQLIPKAYSGPTPTGNSFWLPFSDNSAATATTLGKDGFLLGNNWTPNNLSVTAGAGNDSLTDTPTSYGTDTGAGGSVRGNYCTLNPLDRNSSLTLSNGNLQLNTSSGNFDQIVAGTIQFPTSGKWYYEVKNTSTGGTGANGTNLGIGMINASGQSVAYDENGRIIDSTNTTGLGSFTSGDLLGWAYDADNAKVFVYKNGSLISGLSASGHTVLRIGPFLPRIGMYSNGNACEVNFGQRPFAYTAPSGFKALCDTNLPAPVVAKPSTAFDVKLITANNSTQTISGFAFSPDLVWTKSRSSALSHYLYDSVRGAQKLLVSNATNAESTIADSLISFDANGFTLGANDGANYGTGSSVAWCWDAGSTTVTNTQGSITSSLRASASSGFSVATWTGNGTNGATVGHGLGVSPRLIITKDRDDATNWSVYHNSLANTHTLFLNTTDASTATAGGGYYGTISSTTFALTQGSVNFFNLNNSGSKYVAYCFAPVAGYSAFGSYTGNGNGSADGPFVYLGFRPAVVLVKMSSSTGNWTILDDKREGYNVDNDPLYPNLSDAEGTTDLIDITSNGFKVRTTDANFNTNAGTYTYAAWASSPFAYSRAR